MCIFWRKRPGMRQSAPPPSSFFSSKLQQYITATTRNNRLYNRSVFTKLSLYVPVLRIRCPRHSQKMP